MSETGPPPPAGQSQPDSQPRCVESSELFGADRVVYIRHAGQWYRLQITRNEKLILQK